MSDGDMQMNGEKSAGVMPAGFFSKKDLKFMR